MPAHTYWLALLGVKYKSKIIYFIPLFFNCVKMYINNKVKTFIVWHQYKYTYLCMNVSENVRLSVKIPSIFFRNTYAKKNWLYSYWFLVIPKSVFFCIYNLHLVYILRRFVHRPSVRVVVVVVALLERATKASLAACFACLQCMQCNKQARWLS